MRSRSEVKVNSGVSISIDPALAAGRHVVSVTADGVAVRAKDSRAAAQALYHLEDLMNLRRAPFLAFGTEDRTPLFSPRMTHSGFACDEFPDPYLRHIAHAGMDAILIFTFAADSTKGHPAYQDINDTIRRAKKVGIDTYLYSYVTAFAHPREAGSAAVFENTFGRLSKAHPEAKGYILVGESCEFPSKDPRVIPVEVAKRGKEYEGDMRPMAPHFPCNDYQEWFEAVKKAVRKYNPQADVVVWTYNWGHASQEKPRLELIDRLPKDVSLMATWEMFESFKLPNGYPVTCADYSLTTTGPGRYFSADAVRAKRNGLRLYSQTCTGGITWDFGDIPYMPVPQHWKRRWDRMRTAHDDWGLVGLMEGHHMGWHPSFISELSKEAFTRGGLPFEKHLRMIAARDFGEANAEAAVAAFEKLSEASRYIAPTYENLWGPFRQGPAYPFNVLGPRIETGIGGKGTDDYPWRRYASNGMRVSRLNYADDQVRQWVEGLDYFPRLVVPPEMLRLELEALGIAEKLYREGAATLQRSALTLTGARRVRAMKIANIGEFMGRACRTAANVKAATAAEDVILSTKATDAEKAAAKAKILALAKDEYANTEAALPLVDADSRLGWEPSMEYGGGREQLEWKLKRMRENYGFSLREIRED